MGKVTHIQGYFDGEISNMIMHLTGQKDIPSISSKNNKKKRRYSKQPKTKRQWNFS